MIGVKFPFTISGGSVVTTSNPTEILGSQVTFCLGTLIGERVMRPTWGVDLMSTVHALGADLDEAIEEAVEDTFQAWFPDYEPRGIDIERNNDNPAYIEVIVRYGRYDSELDSTVRVATQLASGTEIDASEGL